MSAYAAESERLWLQPLSLAEHLEDYYDIVSRPESMFWSTGGAHTDIKETESLILQSLPTPEKPWNVRYAVLLRPDPRAPRPEGDQKPKMIGIVGTPRESEVAYKLHPGCWGKGYMSEALAMFIKLYWMFEGIEDNLDARLLANADPENNASNRVLIKAGFQRGGMRKAYYERAVSKGVKSDLQSYYLERPKN